ncbi:MAG: PaaI family thioesterase [Rhodospirillales bacterium]
MQDYAERELRKRDVPIGFMAHVGAEIVEVGPGTCTVSVTRRPELLQRLGWLHGGVIAFLVDNSAGIAVGTLLGPGQAVVTAEFKVNFLAPARGERVFSRARVIKPGRRTVVVAADVYSVQAGAEIHAATALVTIAIVAAPAEAGAPS